MAVLPALRSVYRLVAAEGVALRAHNNERFVLRVPYSEVHRNGLRLDVTDALVGGRVTLTMEGASTLTLEVQDPEWTIEASGVLDVDRDGRLGKIDIEINGIWFRLVKATRQDPAVCQFVFEDLTIAVLREHDKPMKASRGSMTRSQFLGRMVDELPAPLRLYFSPEIVERQPIARPDYPDARPVDDETGFDKGARFEVQGAPANAAQKREIATVLGVCDQENVSDLVRLAIIVAGLGESGFVPERVSTAGAKGVFQLMPDWWSQIGWRDTEKQARHFINSGFYRFGSAKKLAAENPQMSAGEIASRVEGSATDGQNAGYYNQYIPEAKAIIRAWRGGNGGPASGDTVYTLQNYQFTRGLPGLRETSWDAMTRLAEEVNWRVCVVGGVVVYASDDWLISQSARLTIPTPFEDYLLDRPTYDWDHGKLAGDIVLKVVAERWSQIPSTVVYLEGRQFGPVRGRWLVLEVDQNIFDETDCEVTLTKPIKPRREPAAEVETVAADEPGGTGSGTGSIYYAGDSLGVGTLPYFRRLVPGTRLDSNVVGGRSSFDGAQALEAAFRGRRYDNIVCDVGTNDQVAKMLRESIKSARRIAPEAHLYVMTLNGPFDTGAKNKLLADWSDAHVHIVDWHANSRGLLASDGIHATAEGYRKRARLIAKTMGFV